MYKIFFNTAAASTSDHRKNWERQLIDDFIREIHRKEFSCKNEKELEQRFNFIAGIETGDFKENTNFVFLSSPRYGKRKLPCAMYGIPQGYVQFTKILDKIERTGYASIPFKFFYDIRQCNMFKGCYIEIFGGVK